ncbi:MAG: squalene/phytoene synthase family protein [Chloroflexota bacterium]
MALQTHTWEQMLLTLAHEAYTQVSVVDPPRFDQALLNEAYAYCDAITKVHSRSFYLASQLLPAPKRQAVRALYAFCRVSDDIVDCMETGYTNLNSALGPMSVGTQDKSYGGVNSQGSANLSSTDQPAGSEAITNTLSQWRCRILSNNPAEDDLIAIAWTDTRLRYQVPWRYAEQLIDGIALDLVQNRYENFSALASYCYGAASTVGLMSMHIIGYDDSDAIPYAIKLGVALQITNILRDVAEDFRAGRVYLPQDELAEFGLCDEDIGRGIETGVVTSAWRRFMQFQIDRLRTLYAEAMPGIAFLDRDGQFSIRAAAELYQGILSDIEVHDYDVFTRRAHVKAAGKLAMLPGIWYRTRVCDQSVKREQ